MKDNGTNPDRDFVDDVRDGPTILRDELVGTPKGVVDDVRTSSHRVDVVRDGWIHPGAGEPAKFQSYPIETAEHGTKGLRYDEGKVRYDLIPPEWTAALAVVLTRGAIKYAARNWELGMAWSKCVGCLFRHVAKFICGERYDPESGCHHLAHAAWNCLALMSYDIRKAGVNDLVGRPLWMDAVAVEPGPELKAKMKS